MPEHTLEEYDAAIAGPPVQRSASEIKLEAADLPDALKGQTLGDITKQLDGLKQALRVSEESRLALTESIRNRQPDPSIQAPPSPRNELPVKTREELAEMMQTDPMAVVDYMAVHMKSNLDTHFEQRFAPLAAGTMSAVEAAARAQYKDEFDLFPEDIEKIKKQVNPNILTTKEGWNDIMTFVRGMPGNIDKLVDRKMNERSAPRPTLENVREEQRRDRGFTPTPTSSTVYDQTTTHGLDATQMEICRVAGWDPAEYKKNLL